MSTAPTPAFVLWFGPTGLAIARSLGRRGIPVIALHHDLNEPCTGTRYADVRSVPPLAQNESAWLETLLEEGAKHGEHRSPLFAAGDPEWLFIARHRQALSRHFVFPLPDAPNVEQWITKTWQYAAAESAGIEYPRMNSPRTCEELHDAAASMPLPCVMKPALSHVWLKRYGEKLTFARSREQLLARGCDALNAGVPFSVQEHIPADDSDVYGLYSYIDRSGGMTGACVSRKVRQFVPRFGSSCMSQSVHEPRVVELGTRLLQSMGFRGISSVEFKRDRRDGRFKLMEVNVRAPLLMAVAIDSGVDLPWLMYRDLAGVALAGAPEMVLPKRLGRRAGIFAQDLMSGRFYRRAGELTLGGWLASWLRTRDLHFAWDDMGPFRGYLHMLAEHWRKGRLRGLPPEFPDPDQWRSERMQE